MSNRWDLHCVRCGAGAGIGWNHGDDALAEMLPHLKGLADLARLMRVLPSRVEVTVRCGFGEGSPDMDFFVEHEGHPIVVMSEYGYRLGDCNRRIGNTFDDCRLAEGHDGDCSPDRPPAAT